MLSGSRGWARRCPKQLTPYVESDEDRERLVNRYRTFQLENHDQLMAHYEGVIDTLALMAK